MKHINKFPTVAAYDAAEKYYPNVSYIEATDEVKYVESDPFVANFRGNLTNDIKLTHAQQLFSSITAEGIPLTISGTGPLTYRSYHDIGVVYDFVDPTTIGQNAFDSCSDMISVTIPNNVTAIGDYAFIACPSLTSITIPDSVLTINNGVFFNCTSLTSATIGNSVTTIGQSAFENCTSLTSITCLATTPPSMSHRTLFNVPATCPIYVPAESVADYQAAQYWSDRADYIQAIP